MSLPHLTYDPAEIDEVNASLREGHLSKDEVELLDNIVNILNELPPLNNIRLYRGLEEFKLEYLTDPGITFKSADLQVALGYADKALLIMDYPGETKQLDATVSGEQAYMSYPGEIFELTAIEPYNETITMYYVTFKGANLIYRMFYFPEKEAKIKETVQRLARDLRAGIPLEIVLVNPEEVITITRQHPYKSLTGNLAYMKGLIKDTVYSNRLLL